MSMGGPDWPLARQCARTMRERAGRALPAAGWWTLGAVAVWVLSQAGGAWLMDIIAPLPDPDSVAAGTVSASPLALLVTVAVRLLGVAVQLVVFCALPLPALYGMAWICVRAHRSGRATPADMLGPLRRPWSFAAVVGMLAVAVAVPFVLWAVAIVVAGVAIAMHAASAGTEGIELTIRVWWASVILAIPFVVVSVWIQCRWVYAPLALADGMSPVAALKESWRITGTRPASAWARIALAMAGWFALAAAALVLPLAWVGLPRVAAIFAAGYALVRDRAAAPAHRPHDGSAHGSQ